MGHIYKAVKSRHNWKVSEKQKVPFISPSGKNCGRKTLCETDVNIITLCLVLTAIRILKKAEKIYDNETLGTKVERVLVLSRLNSWDPTSWSDSVKWTVTC